MSILRTPHPLRIEFRAQRERLMSQVEAAAKCGVRKQALSTFENATGRPNIVNLRRYCAALGFDFEGIMQYDTRPKPTPRPTP